MHEDQWPSGASEMAHLIRVHDWASTPLGPIAGWPQSLKTVVDMMLCSQSMMSLVWGAEAIHLYNDSFTELLREHRTLALGRSAYETFARSRDVFEADISAGMAGRSARLLAQCYPVLRQGRLEQAWFDVDYVPIRDEVGTIAGVLWTLKETTAQHLAEQALAASETRHRLLVSSWAQAVWETNGQGVVIADSPSWRAYTGQTLEEWLGYGWLDAIHPDDQAYAERQWREAMKARTLVNAEYRLRASDGGWRWTNVRAAPVFDASGQVEKWLGMNIDIDSRKRAEVALLESEQKYRSLFNTVRQGLAINELVRDGNGRVIDARYIDLNTAYEEQTGLNRDRALGRLASEIFPHIEPFWLEMAERVVETGQPEHIERFVAGTDRWFAFDMAAVEGTDQFVVLYDNITERKQAEAVLRESEERQAFLLKLSDAVRPLADPANIQGETTRLLREQLNAGWCYYVDWDLTEKIGLVLRDSAGDGLPSLAGAHDVSDASEFLELLTDGVVRVVRDYANYEQLPAHIRQGFVELGFRSMMMAPLVKEGRLIATMIVGDTEVRDWSAGEASFLVEAAERTWAGVERARAEAALRGSEARFRSLVMAGRYLTYRMSPDWRRMYHLSGQGIIADTVQPIEDWAELYLLPEDRPAIFEAIAQAIRTKSLFELEHRVRQADGGISWVISRAVPILGANDEIEEWFGADTDVTARREAQERLREAEKQYRKRLENEVRERTAELQASRDLLQATMDASIDMIQVFEAIRDTRGQIVDFRWVLNNHTSESRYGKVEGESLLERNPGVLVEGIFDAFKRVTETGEPEQAEHHYVHEQFDGWFYQSVVKLGDGVATTTKEISEWKAAQAAILHLQDEVAQGRLRESEERLRQFGEASQDMLWIRDAESLQWTYLTPAFEVIYGLSRKDALVGDNYRSWQNLIVAEDRVHALASIGRVQAGEQVTFEYRIRRPSDGQLRWLRDTDFPMRDDTGRVVRIGGVGHDVTALKVIETALTRSEGRLRALVEGVSQLVWRAVGHGDWTWASPQWTAFTGQAEAESHGLGWLATVHPDDRGPAMAAWERVLDTEGLQAEFRIRNAATGAYRWFQTRAAPRRDTGGAVVEWLGTSTDVHQLKDLQESQSVMVAELQHRTRNLIGVVRGIADDTMEHTGPGEAFRTAFSDRLSALSRVQGLLSRAEVEPITLAAVVHLELDALGAGASGDRVTMSGPDVWLRNITVQTLALALHELATNARKYGALSHERGRLAVTWSEHVEDSESRFLLDWSETGLEHAPTRAQPAIDGGGYGRELIELALPHALGARTTYLLTKTGLHCTIDLPSRPDPRDR